jgi:hypothetical protein
VDVEPDPDKIRIQCGPLSGSDSQSKSMRAKMTQKNIKQFINLSFAVLDVLFLGLKTSLVGKTSFMKA